MKRVLLLSMIFSSIACGTTSRAQAPFSCDQLLGIRRQPGTLGPELSAWIVLTTRRFAHEEARTLWEKVPPKNFPCADLNCIKDEEIVARGPRVYAETRTDPRTRGTAGDILC